MVSQLHTVTFLSAASATLAGISLLLGSLYAAQLELAFRNPAAMAFALQATKAGMIAMYVVAPVVTLCIGFTTTCIYIRGRLHPVFLEPLYTCVAASILAVGWLVTATIWGVCYAQAHAGTAKFGACYQNSLLWNPHTSYVHGVSSVLGVCLVVIATAIFVVYVVYASIAGIQTWRDYQIRRQPHIFSY